jgi:hypothetical protein
LIRIVGRTARNGANTTLYFDWPSVYIEVEVQTGPLSIILQERWDHGNEYSISIDGVESFQLNTTNASTECVILKQGQAGHVRIEKVSEGRPDIGGLVAFHGLKAGKLQPLQKKPSGRRIECVGDSAMVGNHAERWYPYPSDCPTTRGTPQSRESSRLSWCTKVARALDADYEMVGESGNGLIMTDGAQCHSVGGPDTCIPAKWPRRLSCANNRGEDPDRACPGLGGNEPLDTPFAPQAVLINLGGNDYGKPPKCPVTEQWVQHYPWFVGNISKTYDGTGAHKPTFFLVGGYGDGITKCKNYHDTKAAVASMHAAGLSNVHFLDLTMDGRVLNETTGFIQDNATGCANHPSWIRNDMMAAIAVPKVKAALGWE